MWSASTAPHCPRDTILADPEGRASGTRHHSLFTPTRLKAGTARMHATHVGRLGGRAGHVGRLRDRATCVGELTDREASPDESGR